ncbi:GntR family transcriptional regulator [Streptomyces sp. NPDC002537]
MTPPTHDQRPPYQQAAEAIRQEIESGRLKPGDQLPSHRELQERFGIANMTARSALRVLRDEALIYTVQGRGSFVTDRAASDQESAPVRRADVGPASEEASGPFTETLRAIRDELRLMSVEMAAVKQEVAHLKAQLEDSERRSAF